MFDLFSSWQPEICGYRTLHLVDRPVLIDTAKAFPALTRTPRRDELAMHVKAGGFWIDGGEMTGRQIAWIRRANDGNWIAICLLPVRSGNGRSQVAMQLWLEPGTISAASTIANDPNNDRDRG